MKKIFSCKIKKHNKETPSNYFEEAKSWADDYYSLAILSRNRYQIAFYSCLAVCALFLVTLMSLLPLQHTQLIVVHQGQAGYNWVTISKPGYQVKPNWARSQAEIAHYVISRESYDPVLYAYQSNEVKLLSSSSVNNQYALSQASSNKSAPINLLAAKGYRTITINSILPISNKTKNKAPIAQVSFITHDFLFGSQRSINTPYTALVSWRYLGVPNNPNKALHDWDGFQVTKYLVQPVITEKDSQ